jgi:hypothetical protein
VAAQLIAWNEIRYRMLPAMTNIPAILILENEALIRLSGVGTFADAGFRVIEANSGDLSRASRGSDSNSGNNGPAVPDRR